MISFENSNKWPSDVQYVGNLLSYYMMKLADAISKDFKTKCHQIGEYQFEFKTNGISFRIVPNFNSSINLKAKSTAESSQLDLFDGLELFYLRHPNFKIAARLVKRWLNINMLQTFFTEELIELLLCASYHSFIFRSQSYFLQY